MTYSDALTAAIIFAAVANMVVCEWRVHSYKKLYQTQQRLTAISNTIATFYQKAYLDLCMADSEDDTEIVPVKDTAA